MDNTAATDILMTQVIFDYKSLPWVIELIFLFELINTFMNFSVNCHLTASYLSADHFWPKTSKWATPNICEFLEHTRSILLNSEHLFMSSQRRGYLPMPTGLDTRWIIFCILWFFFGKTKLHLVIWINFRVEDWVCMLPWKYCTAQLCCFSKLF